MAASPCSPSSRATKTCQAQVVARIAEEVNLAPVEGQLSIDGLQVSGTPGRLGRAMDVEATRARLAQAVRSGAGGSDRRAVAGTPSRRLVR